MKRILILVEGQTEEKFVKSILQPHLKKFGTIPIPTIIKTKVVKGGKNYKGGVSKYSRIEKDIKKLLHDSDAKAVTTMIDFYSLPGDFPWQEKPDRSVNYYSKIEVAEEDFKENIGNERFIPYLQLHEFEGILFSSPVAIAKRFEEERTNRYKSILEKLENILKKFNTPEEINDDPKTCPSKRLETIIEDYRKAFHGPIIARYIGLDVIRGKCPHFSKCRFNLQVQLF